MTWDPKIPFSPARNKRIEYIGRAIAEHGNKVPMVIVERFWKENELKKWGFFKTETHFEYIAYAIGVLKIHAARELLQSALDLAFYKGKNIKKDAKWYDLVREQVTKALGNLGDPRSVPTLVDLLEEIGKLNLKECRKTRIAAATAILQCMDKRNLQYLKDKSSKIQTEWVRIFLKEAIKRLEKGVDEGNWRKDEPIVPTWAEGDSWEVIFQLISDKKRSKNMIQVKNILYRVLKVDPTEERIAIIGVYQGRAEIFQLNFYYDNTRVWLTKVIEKDKEGNILKEHINQSMDSRIFVAPTEIRDIILDFPSFPIYQTPPHLRRQHNESIQLISSIKLELSSRATGKQEIKTIQKWEENADSMSDDMVCEDDGLGGTECGYSKKYVKKLKKELNKILDEALK